MKILILGGDGYLGWPTSMFLSKRGHDVAVVDNYFRRTTCHRLNIEPLVPTLNLHQRTELWNNLTGNELKIAIGDITDYSFLSNCFNGKAFQCDNSENNFCPDVVIHYAEQPSAPYSMMGIEEARFTLNNNLIGTLNLIHAVKEFNPRCHIIKLGTMGVYGTPNIDIEEGYLQVEHNNRKEKFLFPKSPSSLYHLTKAQDGDMLYFYAKVWGLRVTDLNQGPVYGLQTDESTTEERLLSIFNYDEIFGTVLNRFIVQAVCGIPLTVYGQGGQQRGYLNIKDTLACVELSMLNPPDSGCYRVFNQFVETFSVNDLAQKVLDVAKQFGLDVKIKKIRNPRKEMEDHYYNPKHTGLLELGLTPHYLSDNILGDLFEIVLKYQNNIKKNNILPKVNWS
jgi:UDP-sulfoquinovose synthase